MSTAWKGKPGRGGDLSVGLSPPKTRVRCVKVPDLNNHLVVGDIYVVATNSSEGVTLVDVSTVDIYKNVIFPTFPHKYFNRIG